jgi:uncharacterized coiled-coil protein SlyX
MNENLSNQISEQLNSIKRLQDHEQDLIHKLDNSKRDLELAHNGMTSELHQHWEAEDEILQLRMDHDQIEVRLLEAKHEIKNLQTRLTNEGVKETDLEHSLDEISTHLVNAQADLEQREEEVKVLQTELKVFKKQKFV